MTRNEKVLHQISDLYPMLTVAWPDNAMYWGHKFSEILPDLDPTIRAMIQSMPEWNGEQVTKVHLFTDGSSFTNRQQQQESTAAFAFVIVLDCFDTAGAGCRFYAATSHELSSAKMTSSQYHGVGELTHDALSAEAVGMAVTMCWVAQSPFACPHEIHFDNATIGNFVSGQAIWNAGWEHTYLKDNLIAIRHCFHASAKQVSYSHVKSHEGHPMNELADATAKATAKQILLNAPLPACISQVMLNRAFKHAWMTISSPATHPLPYALNGLFKAEGPFEGQITDATWHHQELQVVTNAVTLDFKTATANVLTLSAGTKKQQTQGLMQKGRISTLQAQLHQAGIHLTGLQECRTQDQIVRHSSSHYVFQSGASPEGYRGCELWADRSLPYAQSKTERFLFAAEHFHVAAYDDRSLFVVLKAPHLHIRILVLHAPHQAAHDAQPDQWWSQLQTAVSRIGSHLPLIVLGDMNAQVGSVCSDAISSHGAETETTTGHLLHAFLLEKQLWAPATYEACHDGQTWTWTSTDGIHHRLDFVLVPNAWKDFHIKSYVEQDVDLCTVRDDHMVAVLHIKMSTAASTTQRLHRCHVDVRKCNDPSSQAEFQQYIQHPPHIPWQVGTGEHVEILTEWIQKGAKKCFQRTRQDPKQRYMSETTWNIVQLRKQLLKTLNKAEYHAQLLVTKIAFAAWTSICSFDQQAKQLAPEMIPYIQLLHKYCMQTFAWSMYNRYKLHTAARQSSRQDRIDTAQSVVEQFLCSAQGHDSKQLYRKLQPLLGQTHRRNLQAFRPIPAVKMPDATLAVDHDMAAQRWQQHFAQAEAGQMTTVPELQDIARSQAPKYAAGSIQFDFNSMPTLESIERYIHKARKGKSPGIDGLPAEIFKLNPAQFAYLLWPALAKAALRCDEPLRWKGGEICALPKQPFAKAQVEHFRSILLADFTSKICHGLVRQRLMPSMQEYRLNMQAGGIPHLGTDMLHLMVQSFAQFSKHRGVSSASLFVDIKQAFYRAFRPLLIQRQVSPETVAQLFAANGWSPELYRDFQNQVSDTPALARARVSPHQIAQIDAMLTATWFQIRANPQTLTHTQSGTRPGDSVADLLYAFLMARFLHDLRSQFQAAQLATNLEVKWIPGGPLQPGELDTQYVIQACWVDDLVILLEGESPADLLVRIQRAIAITQDLAVTYGLQLNYGPEKTAVLVALRGPTAQQLWTQILQASPERPTLPFQSRSLGHQGRLDIVPTYVYLGQLQDQKGHPACEVQRRFIMIQATHRLLNRNVFRSPKMPYRTKKQLFQSLILSKLVYGSGAWQQAHVQTIRSWHTQVMKLYYKLVPHMPPGPDTYHLDVLAQCQMPHPMLLITMQRFSLFDRLMQTDLCELFALLQGQSEEESWFAMILQDLAQIMEFCPTHPMTDLVAQQDIALIGQYSAVHKQALTKLGKWSTKHYLATLTLWEKFRTFQRQFETEAKSYGLQWTENPTSPQQAASFECPQCQAVFATYKALCTHMFKKHDALNSVQLYTASNVCRACMRMYDSREQVVHHLKYFKTGCIAKLVATVPPLSQDELQDALQDTRDLKLAAKRSLKVKRHKHPVVRASGPLRPWPWQLQTQYVRLDLRPSPEVDESTFNDWLTRILEASHHQDVLATYDVLVEHPYHGIHASSILMAFQKIDFGHAASRVEAWMTLHAALTLWQDTNGIPPLVMPSVPPRETVSMMLNEIRIPTGTPDAPQMPVKARRKLMSNQFWLDASVSWQIRRQLYRERSKVYIAAAIIRTPVVQTPIFVYIFSGRRRVGDYQSHMETLLMKAGVQGHVLLLDLALSPLHDVSNPALVEQLLRWIAGGAVAGLLAAPPCETWTEARYLETGSSTDPRPLRTALDPFGIEQLTWREISQLDVSSFLLYVTMRALLAAAMHGITAIVEHPREPKMRSRASIWRLPWMQALEQMGYMRRYVIWQAEYGGLAAKPTHLGVCHAPDFKEIMQRHRQIPDWESLQVLGGRDSTGAWTTSRAKEYPDRLNLALADVHLTSLLRKPTDPRSPNQWSTQTRTEFEALYAGHVVIEHQVMQPDFHRRGPDICTLD